VHVAKLARGWDHPHSPIIELACELLQAQESFLWKCIRGTGLAYGVGLQADFENGLLFLSLFRSQNSYLAYAEASKVVRDICDGKITIEQTSLDSAKSSLVYGVAASLCTPKRSASMAFVNETLKGVDTNYDRKKLEVLQPVTVEQIRETIRKYILPLFNAQTSAAFVTSGPGKANEIKDALENIGFVVESRTLDSEETDEIGESESGGESDGSRASR